MKTSTFLSKLLLLVGLSMVALNCEHQNKPKATSGPSDFGGGNIQARNLDIRQIEAEILRVEKAKLNLFYGLQRFHAAADWEETSDDLSEWSERNTDNLPHIWSREDFDLIKTHLRPALEKVFPFKAKKSVFEYLKDLRVVVESEKACASREGDHKDASIYGRNGNICMSAKRLAESSLINSTNITQAIAGLIIHEYSHKMGTTEKEAEALQLLSYFYMSAEKVVEAALDPQIFWDLTFARDVIEKLIPEVQEAALYSEYADRPNSLMVGDTIRSYISQIELWKHELSQAEGEDYRKGLREQMDIYQQAVDLAFSSPRATGVAKDQICSGLDMLINSDFISLIGLQSSFNHSMKSVQRLFTSNLQLGYNKGFCSNLLSDPYYANQHAYIGKDQALSLVDTDASTNLANYIPEDVVLYRVPPHHVKILEASLATTKAYLDEVIQARKQDLEFIKSLK